MNCVELGAIAYGLANLHQPGCTLEQKARHSEKPERHFVIHVEPPVKSPSAKGRRSQMDRALLKELNRAVTDYDFPTITYDFANGRERRHASMASVEAEIQHGLTSTHHNDVMAALSNVLFWGFYRVGYRDVRVRTFREQVTPEQLQAARGAFSRIHGPGLRTIHDLNLPQFSGMSFISKVRMFLDPGRYVILDRKLLTLRDEPEHTVFNRIAMSPRETQIRVSKPNEAVYEEWCEQCRRIARLHFSDAQMRAVDIERGIFHLVDSGRAKLAARILASEV